MCSYEKALQDINKANELYPDSALILLNKGKIECKLHLYKDALESFDSVIKLDFTLLPAYFKKRITERKEQGTFKEH